MAGQYIGTSDPKIKVGVTTEKPEEKEFTSKDLIGMTDLEMMSLPSIKASPLMLGSVLDIEPIRKEYKYRWFAKHPRRYGYAVSQGWEKAVPEDIVVKDPTMVVDNHLEVGNNVILMKIDLLRYAQAMKANHIKAVKLGGAEIDEKSLEIANQTLRGIHAPEAYKLNEKVGFYKPKFVSAGK